jgi:hypothetical protein
VKIPVRITTNSELATRRCMAISGRPDVISDAVISKE